MFQIYDDGGSSSDPASSQGRESTTANHLSVMIAGDSMTHGEEGDHTWRYRVWEWFQNSAPDFRVKFVGPMVGTVPPIQPEPPQPPRFPEEMAPPDRDMNAGGYAKDVSDNFERSHYSHTGRQYNQAKDEIEELVRRHKPDILLVMLGFNDLAWFVGGPEATMERTKIFVDNARVANPNIKFALANVMHCNVGHDHLRPWTTQYNSWLRDAIPEWSTPSSRIEHVDVEKLYGATPDDCRGTFDGIHPNELGDYQIASAFTRTLHHDFGIGRDHVKIPKEMPHRPLPVPTNIQAYGVPYGIRLTFDPVYGSKGYDVRQRVEGQEQWEEVHSATQQVDNVFTGDGIKWEFQVRSRNGLTSKGKWSHIVRGTARRETAPAPKNGQLWPLPTGFEATWDPVDSKWHVDRYAVVYLNEAGGFLCARPARGTYGIVDDLNPGDRFDVWLQTWTAAGPGELASLGKFQVPKSRKDDA